MKALVGQTLSHPIKGNISIQELEECEALLILSSMPFLGVMKIQALVKCFGSAVNSLLEDAETIFQLPGFGRKIASSWENWTEDKIWRNNLLQVIKNHVTLVAYNSPNYPKRLLEIPDAPMLLYIRGSTLLADQRSIAIVGTRQASIYGLEMARRFAYELAAMGFTIVSGLARGIDTAAHLGALERGRSIAVIGSGLADIYPTENRALAEQMVGQGAVISEFPMLTPPDRQNFPQRNRIVCGMTLGTLLIEAPLKSGAMITMERAQSQGRTLFAIPGRIDLENSRGGNTLIKQGKALLVESAAEIATHYESLFGTFLPSAPKVMSENNQGMPLTDEENTLFSLLPFEEVSIEQIILLAKLPISVLNVLLMKLVLKKHLKEFPGKVYKKIIGAKR